MISFCPFHPDIGFLMIRSVVALKDPPYVPTRERQHDRIDAYLYYSTRTYPEQLRKARKVNYNLNFAIVLCTKSTIHVLSNGAYWDVTSLIAS
jgi:hypothetical protein